MVAAEFVVYVNNGFESRLQMLVAITSPKELGAEDITRFKVNMRRTNIRQVGVWINIGLVGILKQTHSTAVRFL